MLYRIRKTENRIEITSMENRCHTIRYEFREKNNPDVFLIQRYRKRKLNIEDPRLMKFNQLFAENKSFKKEEE